MLRNTFTLLAVLGLAATSQAAIIGVVTKRVNPGADQSGAYAGFARNVTTNPAGPFLSDTGLNSGVPSNTWVSYALGVQATAGEKISAFDVTLTSLLSATTGYNQRWNVVPNEDPELPPAITPTPVGTSLSDGDSKLLIPASSTVFVAGAETKFDVGGPPTATDTATQDYGVGTSLTGLWGYSAADQATLQGQLINFGYIVIPRGQEPNFVINIGVANNNQAGEPQDGVRLTNDNFPGFGGTGPIIPEPSTIALLGLALVGGCGFGRRRS